MELRFRLQDQLSLIINADTQTRDFRVANLQRYDTAGENVLVIGFCQSKARLYRQLLDSLTEGSQYLNQHRSHIERMAFQIKQ